MPAHPSPRRRVGLPYGPAPAGRTTASSQPLLASGPDRARTDRPTLGDGWLGTLELPGYRAGSVIAKLDDLPEVDPEHLYFDLLLLDGSGRPQHTHSGPCLALARVEPLEQRSRFVRVVAELLRHVPCDDRGLSAVAPALDFIREGGIGNDRLLTAAQLLDNACSDRAVADSLNQVLKLSLGEDEARRALSDVVAHLARTSGIGAGDGADEAIEVGPPIDGAGEGPVDRRLDAINALGLSEQVSYVVRAVGKARARRYLREATDFALVPQPDMFGV